MGINAVGVAQRAGGAEDVGDIDSKFEVFIKACAKIDIQGAAGVFKVGFAIEDDSWFVAAVVIDDQARVGVGKITGVGLGGDAGGFAIDIGGGYIESKARFDMEVPGFKDAEPFIPAFVAGAEEMGEVGGF